MFDMTSMLLGAAVSGIGLCLTMLTLWWADRSSYFKINWSVGVGFLIVHVFAYWFYARGTHYSAGVLANALQPVGAAFLYASVRQFTEQGFKPLLPVLRLSIPYLLIVPPVFAMGYDGAALVVQNAMTSTLLFLGGLAYLSQWREAPLAIGLCLLYAVAGASFALCGLVIPLDGQWSIGYPPQNWAEELNVVVSVLALSGAGALTLSVDQSRLASRNQLSAMSDPLTGLLNRRGLAAVRAGPLRANEAVALFDLDHFKQINDRYGHAVGDRVIRAFADVLRQQGRTTDTRARLGGEEFAMVMARVSPQQARLVAERVIEAFSAVEIASDDGETFCCTVSAGLAFGEAGGTGMDEAMTRADHALYAAKRSGRNRVESEPQDRRNLRLVG